MMCLKRLALASHLNLIRDIAKGIVQSEALKQKDGNTKKQYYMKTDTSNTGPVKKVKGKLSLTNFGLIIYHAHLII
jgi:hypothetical protein